MKIGIITLWQGVDNYGQQLQIYALQKFLINNGHEPYLIRYNYKNDYVGRLKTTAFFSKIIKGFNPIKLYKYLKLRHQKKLLENMNLNKKRGFDKFRDKYISLSEEIYNSYEELRANPPFANAYIVGSDQVWNPSCLFEHIENGRNLVNSFFLNFGLTKTIRIAYAASWGRKSIPDDWKNEIIHLIKNLDFIGVREESGKNICDDCYFPKEKTEWVCDPTMLLAADHWRNLYKNEYNLTHPKIEQVKPNKPYLLLYYLGNGANFNIKELQKCAKKRNLEIKYVTGNGFIDNYEHIYPTIDEWLKLVDDAKYIITDSFHGSVFSIIFHKQFVTLQLDGKFKGMNDRMTSLFRLCNMESRFVTEFNDNKIFNLLDLEYTSFINNTGGKFLLEILQTEGATE